MKEEVIINRDNNISRLCLRMPADLYHEARVSAAILDMSMNSFIKSAVADKINQIKERKDS